MATAKKKALAKNNIKNLYTSYTNVQRLSSDIVVLFLFIYAKRF